MNVLVSIIVPIYNVEKYLEVCLNSILEYKNEDIEIICVNDGSTDGSKKILEQYAKKDSRIHLYHKENRGYGHTINFGLERCSGKYVMIVESDDYIDKEGIKKLYQIAEIHQADYVRTNYYEYSKEMDRLNESLNIYPYNEVLSALKDTRLFYELPISPWGGIYRRKFLYENIIKMNETPGASYQDNSWQFLVLLNAKKIVFIQDAYYHYRVDNMQSSINNPHKIFCVVDEKMYIEEKLIEYAVNDMQILEAFVKWTYMLYKWNYMRIGVEFQYIFLMEWRKELLQKKEKGWLKKEIFNATEWNEIDEIINEVDKYFRDTAKIYQYDWRCDDSVNRKIYLDGSIQVLLNEKFIMYGTGVVAREVLELLAKNERENNVLCFCETVTDKKEFAGKKVLSFSEMSCLNDNLIVVATKREFQNVILNNLRKNFFSNILVIDESIRNRVKELLNDVSSIKTPM